MQESTKDAELIRVDERLGHSGLPIYEFEYQVDSTRGGMKRIFSAAFVTSRKLYLLNITYSDRPENPLDNSTRLVLEQVLHSFDTLQHSHIRFIISEYTSFGSMKVSHSHLILEIDWSLLCCSLTINSWNPTELSDVLVKVGFNHLLFFLLILMHFLFVTTKMYTYLS